MTRMALAAALLGAAGCSSVRDITKETLPVSVSAANYSQLSDAELYDHVYGSPNMNPAPPPEPRPTKPLFYLLLPGEIYPSDVPVEAVYREMELALEKRGYFNVIYQMRAGHTPGRIDYLIRVHYGERYWLNPIVRPDRITWGNDGIVSSRYTANLMSDWYFDDRVGLTPEEKLQLRGLYAALKLGGAMSGNRGGAGNSSAALSYQMDEAVSRDFVQAGGDSRNYCLVVVEAFRLEDVRRLNGKAPCAWATFIAVPAEGGLKFSGVLRTMLQTAVPYYGGSTSGPQEYEVPPGKVFMGTPVEVPGHR